MPQDLIVHPGDLITADLWNKLQGLIDSVNARIDATEALVVPDLIGDVLPTAIGEIRRASLDLSTVLDAAGTRISDPNAENLDTRIVLAQMPSPEERVRVGRRVSLLISAPAVVATGAPTITTVNPSTARVGGPLEIDGTGFTANSAVTFRNDTFTAGFKVESPTKITFASVPSFAGAPTPGNSFPIAVIVSNDKGPSAPFTVNFNEPQIAVVRPSVTNVRLSDVNVLGVLGSGFSQKLEANVSIGGQPVKFVPVSDSELRAQLPDNVAKQLQSLQSTQPALFKNLLVIDQRDHFRFDQFIGPILAETERAPVAAERRVGVETPIDLGGFIRPQRQTGKFFLILSAAQAEAFAAAGTVTITFDGADAIATTNTGASVRFTPSQLTDLTVAVRVADQIGSFSFRFGTVQQGGGGKGGGGGRQQIFVGREFGGIGRPIIEQP